MKQLLSAILLCYIFGSTNLCAQAFDGSTDRKMFLGTAMVGDKFGIELQNDDGINDLLSYGGKLIFLFSKDTEEFDSFDRWASAYSKIDIGAFLRFHFSEALKLSERTDPFLGLDISLKALGGHVGFKYNFSETLGVYVQAGHSFSGSFLPASPDDNTDVLTNNRFAKKTSISMGLTINIFTDSMGGYR